MREDVAKALGEVAPAPKEYNLQSLHMRSKRVLTMYASGMYKQVDIARILGMSESMVTKILNSPLGKSMLIMLEAAAEAEAVDMLAHYKSTAPMAFAIQTDMMMDENTPLTLKNRIADKIQDRAGYTPISKNLNVNAQAALTREDVLELSQDAEKVRAANAKEVKVDSESGQSE